MTLKRCKPLPDVLPFPRPGPMPLANLARLLNAIREGDAGGEREARRELREIGIRVIVGRMWRRGDAK